MLGPRLYAEANPSRGGRSRARLLGGADRHQKHTGGCGRAHALDETSTRYRHRTLLCDETARMPARFPLEKPAARQLGVSPTEAALNLIPVRARPLDTQPELLHPP